MSNKMPGCHLANARRSRSKHILQWRYYTAMKYQFIHSFIFLYLIYMSSNCLPCFYGYMPCKLYMHCIPCATSISQAVLGPYEGIRRIPMERSCLLASRCGRVRAVVWRAGQCVLTGSTGGKMEGSGSNVGFQLLGR